MVYLQSNKTLRKIIKVGTKSPLDRLCTLLLELWDTFYSKNYHLWIIHLGPEFFSIFKNFYTYYTIFNKLNKKQTSS